MKQRSRNPRSEAAMREAIKNRDRLFFDVVPQHGGVIVSAHETVSMTDAPVALFNLRDCYRKRQPLKGITKAVRRAVMPKRGKK